MKPALVAIVFTLVPIFASAYSLTDEHFSEFIKFDRGKIEDSLESLKTQKTFPPLFPDGIVHLSRNQKSAKPIPVKIVQSFDEINQTVFGKAGVLQLLACAGCEPNIEIGNKTVYIDPDWIQGIFGNSNYVKPGINERYCEQTRDV